MFSSCSDWDNCIIPSNHFYNDNVYNDNTTVRSLEGANVNCSNCVGRPTNCGCGSVCINSGECGEMLPTPQEQQQQQYMTTTNQLNEASSLSAAAAADYESLSEASEESINFNDNNNNYNNINGEINTNNRNNNLDNMFNQNNLPYNNNNICEQNTLDFNNLNLNNNHFNQNNNNSFNHNNNILIENNKQNLNVLNTNCSFNSNNNEFNATNNGCFKSNNVCNQNNNVFNQYNKNSIENNNNLFNINCNFNQNNNICNQNNKNFIENNNQCNQIQSSCQPTSNICIQNNNILNIHSKENTILNTNTNNNNNFISPAIERHHPYRYNSDNSHYYNYQQKLQLQHKTQQFSTYHASNFMNQNHNFVNTTQPQIPQPQFQQQQPFTAQQQQQQQQLVLYNTRAFANATPPPPLEHYTYQTLAPAPPTHLHTSPSPLAGPPRMFANNYYQSQQGIQAYDQQHFNSPQPQLSSRAPSIPCQGNQPWTYAYCYGYGAYSNQGPCQFTQIVDIEDFMNNEKRKERSRDAARCRRSRETEIFTELAQVLPLKKEDVQQLDKASVMRIAIAYLKVRDMLKMFPRIQELLQDLEIPNDMNTNNNTNNSDNCDESSNGAHISSIDLNDSSTQSSQNSEEESTTSPVAGAETKPAPALSSNPKDVVDDYGLMLKHTLDGFLLILSNDGDITYVTGNIADYLGISKIDILGQQIWEYAHQCDHAELKEALNIKRNGLAVKVKDENLLEEGITTDHRDLFVRLKCTLTSRGRSINIKSASYKVIHITGHLVVNAKGDRVLVAMGRPIPHPSNIEIPLGTTTFLTKHSLDMKFTYVDDKMYNLLGYKPEDLLETSLFNYHHGIDSESLMTTFKNVLSKGQGETCRYRFLGKYGGYCWIVTQATIVYDKLKPQSVVCVNFVVSNLEKKYEIYTLQQYEESQKLKELEEKPTTTTAAASNNNTNNNNKIEILNENKLKAEEIIKDHNKTTEDIQKQIITADSAEATAAAATTKIENSTSPPPTPLDNNNNKNNNNNKLNEDIIQLNNIIKQEQQIPPPIIINNNNKNYFNKNKIILPTTTISATATATISIPAAVVKPTNYTPPPQQALPPTHCPTTTVTHTVFSKSKSSPSITDDKGPKTVTSSLILTSLPTTTSTQSILHQLPLNVATRAQSVTASVFSPLPETPNKSSNITEILPQSLQEETETQSDQQQTTQETNIISQHQDMNKGFLSFAEDATELTMLKEEPDDLTAHLVATNAVDACMPLDESGPLFGEILVGFGMNSYGSLLTDDINSLDSNTSSTEHINTNSSNNISKASSSCNTNSCSTSSLASPTSSVTTYNNGSATSTHRQSSPSLITTTACASTTTNSNTTAAATTTSSTNIDPFINYRDESNDTNCSQHLLSPSVTSKSPEGSSLPSLCSPNSLSQEDEFPYYTMNVDDMDDLTMRAPYIPMNEQDDLPLLTSDDYMWSSGNAFTPDEFSLHTKDSDNALQAMQINQSMNYQQQQFTQQQQQQQQQQAQQFSNSLCSSPASTVSSMSPSPIQQQQQQQQQQQNSQQIFSADTSELAALLCGSGNTSLSILQDTTNFTNSLNLNGGGVGAGAGDNSVGLNDDLDSVSVASPTAASPALDQHQQLQQQCLQQFQEQLQQQQREQQQQQLLSGLNINCKKEKFDTANNSPSMTPNLCDTIDDAFDSVYNSKNSTNLDCWNEFLQINTNENTNTTNNAATATQQQQQQDLENLRQEDCKQQLQMQLQQQQQQTQNIIINAVLINGTIQTTTSNNNKNILVPTLTNNQQQQQQQSQSNTKSLNKVNTIKFTPITSTATKLIENKQTLLQQQQQQQQNNIIKTAYIQAAAATQSNNKRHLSATQIANNAMESKRLKSNNIVMDLQNSNTTSQLLQQLITNPQQQGNLNGKNSKTIAADSRWSASNENHNHQQQQQLQQHQQQQQQQKQHQHQKQSNSVLKNLLISGCDKTKMEILTLDDNSRSSMQSPDLCLSPSMARPIQCVTTPSNVLRSYRHNPWIGGPGVLPSPTNIALISGEECSTTYSSCDNTIDSVSDSGIDDASIAENVSPLKRTYEQQTAINNLMINNLHIDNNTTNMTSSNKIEQDLNIIGEKANLLQEIALGKKLLTLEDEDDDGASMSKRKRSISFLDSNNPLMTPFLMDLCNDDYQMNAKEYLQENDIENVLNEWSVNLV